MKKIIIPFLCVTLFSTAISAQKKATTKVESAKPAVAEVNSKTILDNYLTALGGKAKLEAVKSIITEEQISVQGMDIISVTKKMGNKFKSVQTVMGQKVTTVFDGNKGYMDQMGTKTDFPQDKIEELKKAKTIDALGFGDTTYNNSVEKIDNKNYNVLTSDRGKLYFDTATGLLYKTNIGGVNMTIKSYKEVDGLKFPEQMEAEGNGQNIVVKTSKITVNSGVSEADFQ